MKGRKKKVLDFDEYYKNLNKPSNKDAYAIKYRKSIDSSRGSELETNLIRKLKLRTGNYSMRTRVLQNPWVSNRPASQATKWLHREVFKNPRDFRYTKRLIFQGGMFTFEYFNPKYKGTSVLPWFDRHPLVISLGPVVTNLGVRNLGFNLHLLPPKIRVIVMCGIFEMYKKLYRYQIFFKQNKPVQINYKQIVEALSKYGVKFCIRMYIPQRMNHIVNFPIKTWHKAIFIPSKGYDSIRAKKLIKEWKKYVSDNGYAASPNMDWKSII